MSRSRKLITKRKVHTKSKNKRVSSKGSRKRAKLTYGEENKNTNTLRRIERADEEEKELQ